ncbi:MAG: hypothetical protein K2N74_02485 [Clostridiales bacterium]|nr:hypothetical protein [Clostridiales bacterium]
MVRYMKCPRCELNYIDAEKQEYCDICLKELKGIADADEIEEVEEEVATELCPVCGENMMRPGEKMCDECRRKTDYEAEEPDPEDDDDEWRNYLDDDGDDELDSEIGEIGETFEGEFDEDELEEEEEEEYGEEEEDLEYVTGDEIYTLTDDEEDEEDEGDDF